MRRAIAFFALALTVGCASAHVPGQHAGSITTRDRRPVTTKYLLHVPASEDSARRFPVIVYLHGGSLRGDDVERLRTMGLPKRVESDARFPFIVVSPLCPAGEIWSDAEALDALLDHVLRTTPADPERVYVTGHSMGGRGALYFAFRHPERFAAVAAISPLSPVDAWAPVLGRLQLRIVHGARDEAAPVSGSDSLVEKVRAVGGSVDYDRREDADHFLLGEYDGDALFAWLLQHRRVSN